MQVEMIHRLTRFGVDVKDSAVALLVDIKLLRYSLGDLKHVGEEVLILLSYVIQCRNVLPWAYQHVHGSLRAYVFECHYEVILMHYLRRRFPSNDPAKEA